VEEYISQGNFKEFVVIPLVDFDKQGQEYLQEIHEISENLRIKVDSEIRRDLYNLTHGKLPEFEDLFYFLKKKLHPNYYLVLTQSLNIEFEY
jgi:5S rRNA maturation endonuclease (ribonuclease M5)